MAAITAMINPPIGPDAPMSMSDRRSGMGGFIFITAPKVPIIEGAGIKYGRVADTLCLRDIR